MAIAGRYLGRSRLFHAYFYINLLALTILLSANSIYALGQTRGYLMESTTLAFEGAEGYGAATIGGRGGTVVHVTNLNDNGVGSLRWALEKLEGPRIVVFDVAGTIQLKEQILIEHGNVTIAGQTSPGEGITLTGAGIRVKADEVIMRGLHVRPGDGEGKDPDNRDALMIGTTDFTVHNVIVDHNSFTWAIDENVAINGKVKDISFTNNIVAEGLSKSLHSKGEHSKGILLSNWGGEEGDASYVTIAKNFLSDNMQRNAEIRAGQHVEYVNNYIYNYGLGHVGMYVGGGNGGTLQLDVDVIGNVWQPGVNTNNKSQPIMLAGMTKGSEVVLADNIFAKAPVDANGNQNQSGLYTVQAGQTMLGTVSNVRADGSNVAILDSTLVKNYVLANAGALNGSGLDAIDGRIIDEAKTGSGRIINAVSEVFNVASTKSTQVAAPADSDRDGMPDWFEDIYGFDKRNGDDKGDNDGDGYTNVEEYINGLISGFNLGPARVDKQATGDFRINATTLDTPARLIGFLAGGGAPIDLSAVIKSFDPEKNSLSDFVEIAYAGGNSYISVDSDGPAGSSLKRVVAVVEGSHLTLSDVIVHPSALAQADLNLVVSDGVTAAPVPTYDPHVYLEGTLANDTHTIRTELDRIVEASDGGSDIAVSYVDYTLDANVESLSLKNGAVSGTGNALDNKMVGNDQNNILSGLFGNDRITGGNGDDLISGGSGDDWVEGNAGDDILSGGTGADTYFGGAGRDWFCFDTGDSAASKTATQDRITDFCADDVIVINGSVVDMTSLASGTAGKYADAYNVAAKIVAGEPDKAIIHGARDSWMFWDENGDGVIDQGVTLTGAALTKASWVAPHGEMPAI